MHANQTRWLFTTIPHFFSPLTVPTPMVLQLLCSLTGHILLHAKPQLHRNTNSSTKVTFNVLITFPLPHLVPSFTIAGSGTSEPSWKSTPQQVVPLLGVQIMAGLIPKTGIVSTFSHCSFPHMAFLQHQHTNTVVMLYPVCEELRRSVMGDGVQTLPAMAPNLNVSGKDTPRQQLQAQLQKNPLNFQTHFKYYGQELDPDKLKQKPTRPTNAEAWGLSVMYQQHQNLE